jgi:hypothetical protein
MKLALMNGDRFAFSHGAVNQDRFVGHLNFTELVDEQRAQQSSEALESPHSSQEIIFYFKNCQQPKTVSLFQQRAAEFLHRRTI